MKLLSLHIDGFGRLSNFKYDFSDKLNVIEADNGFGKTTIAAFIKAMLYGLQSANARGKVENNDRLHYTPWNGGAFGGSLDLETAKGRFRVTRRFGSKSSLDDFSLTDLDTGLASQAYSENLGIELFGLDASSYEKSTYVPHNDTELSMAADINAKLTGLLQSDDDMSQYDRAVERLEDYMRTFKRLTGDAGLIQDTRRELDNLLGRINERERSLEKASNYRGELANLEKELEEIEVKTVELKALIKEANEQRIAREHYKIYLSYLRSASREKERLDSLRSAFENGLPNSTEINELSALCTKYETSMNSVVGMSYADETELAALADRFGDIPVSESDRRRFTSEAEELKELEAKLSDPPKKPDPFVSKKNKVLLPAGIAGFLAGAAVLFVGIVLPMTWLTLIGITVDVAAASILTLSLILSGKHKKAEQLASEQLEEYTALLSEFEKNKSEHMSRRQALEAELSRYYPAPFASLDTVLYRLENDSNRYSALLFASDKYTEEREAKRRENKALLERIYEQFDRYNVEHHEDLREMLDSLKGSVRDIAESERRLAEAEKQAEDYRNEKQITEEPPIPRDTAEISETLTRIGERADRIHLRMGILTEARDQAESHAESLPALRDEAELLKARILDYESRRSTADRARKLLLQAKNGLSSRYLRDMEESFAENFSSVNGISAPETLINADLGITFREVGGQRELSWYSSGQQAAISICLRLALIDAIFTEEQPFLVLDDPFTDLDADKLENAAKMMRSLSEKLQIVYFTCHSSRNIG